MHYPRNTDGTQIRAHRAMRHPGAVLFSEPTRFWSERWKLLDAHDSKVKDSTGGFAHDEAAFHPFSDGPLNCSGSRYGNEHEGPSHRKNEEVLRGEGKEDR
ncbi:uncharacterized protein BXZ73DRAFT_75771 [Epithele typhae]|uniref:uncharacterized protein n=1 Tax=Epithele typhae TaxID=378194 RepID=UPI002007AF7B|nr:uncharacterized protein BXZ73DRAFT_75771 [Epithele typhae]KAH9940172.1 hypothetical protein BXZ73DRAFT_75771 [Epithele typhae]